MSDGFEVDLAVMGRLVLALRSSTDMMEQALDALRDTGRNSLGSRVLDDAADDFQHTWRYGLGKLKDKTKDTGDRMQGTFEVYDTVEQKATEAFDKLVELLTAAAR